MAENHPSSPSAVPGLITLSREERRVLADALLTERRAKQHLQAATQRLQADVIDAERMREEVFGEILTTHGLDPDADYTYDQKTGVLALKT